MHKFLKIAEKMVSRWMRTANITIQKHENRLEMGKQAPKDSLV